MIHRFSHMQSISLFQTRSAKTQKIQMSMMELDNSTVLWTIL